VRLGTFKLLFGHSGVPLSRSHLFEIANTNGQHYEWSSRPGLNR
jgi:hypothetical protein